MDPIASSLVTTAGSAPAGSVQATAAVSVLKKSQEAQAAGAAKLLDSVAQPTLATAGAIGTRLHEIA